jgi:hypothetical protein
MRRRCRALGGRLLARLNARPFPIGVRALVSGDRGAASPPASTSSAAPTPARGPGRAGFPVRRAGLGQGLHVAVDGGPIRGRLRCGACGGSSAGRPPAGLNGRIGYHPCLGSLRGRRFGWGGRRRCRLRRALDLHLAPIRSAAWGRCRVGARGGVAARVIRGGRRGVGSSIHDGSLLSHRARGGFAGGNVPCHRPVGAVEDVGTLNAGAARSARPATCCMHPVRSSIRRSRSAAAPLGSRRRSRAASTVPPAREPVPAAVTSAARIPAGRVRPGSPTAIGHLADMVSACGNRHRSDSCTPQTRRCFPT